MVYPVYEMNTYIFKVGVVTKPAINRNIIGELCYLAPHVPPT